MSGPKPPIEVLPAEGRAEPAAPLAGSRLSKMWPVVESLLGALVLDAIDMTDIPLLSWVWGVPASLLIGYWIAHLFKFPIITRFGLAIMAAIYFMLPGTEAIPLATIAVAAARVAGLGQLAKKEDPPALPK